MPVLYLIKMKLLTEKDYTAPCVEMILVDVEKGFSASGGEGNDEGGITLPDWGFI